VSRVTAFAVYASGLALLEGDDELVVQQLVEFADGDTGQLLDARDLLSTIGARPEQVERAKRRLENAMTRVARARRAVADADLARDQPRRT
jgi:flagellin-like hook-associated protein FlgL